MPLLELGEPVAEVIRKYVSDPEAVAADLVGVGRSNALEGGAYLALACSGLLCCVEQLVGRKDEVGLLGDAYLPVRVDAEFLHACALLPEGDRVKYDTAAYDVGGTIPEYA